MKNLSKSIAYSLIGLMCFFFFSCDENEIDTSNTAPFFYLQIINASRADSVEGAIADIDTLISKIDAEIFNYDTLTNDDEDYQEQKDSLNAIRTSLNLDRQVNTNLLTTLNSGETYVNQIVSLGDDGDQISYTAGDSSDIFKIDLNFNKNISQYRVYLNDTLFPIKATYTTSIVEEERKIKKLAYNFLIEENLSFYDSLIYIRKDSTTNNNESNECTAIIYY